MKKRAEMTALTQKNLRDAFWSLYCEKRIEKITVREVADRAGYNRGTFYEYYQDVYGVLEEIERGLIPTLAELPPVSAPAGPIGMPLEGFVRLWERNAQYYAVLLGERGDPAFAGKLKASIKPILQDLLAGRPGADLRTLDYTLEYTLSAMIGIMTYWFLQPVPLPREELFGLIHRLMEDGVIRHLPI